MREASLRHVLAVLRDRWLLMLAMALPVLATSGGYAASLPPAHIATVVLSFAPAQGADPGASFVRLIARYELTATSHDAVTRAEQQAGLAPGDLADSVSAQFPDDRLELTLTVTTPEEEASLAAAGALVAPVVEAVAEDPLVSVWTAAEPELTGDETPRRRAIIMVAGLLLAPVPGTALALVLEGSRPRVRLPEDLYAAGVPVLQSTSLRRVHPRAAEPGQTTQETRPRLRLWLLVTGVLHRWREAPSGSVLDVVVTSADRHEHDADAVVQGLRRAGESIREELRHGPAHPVFRSAPLDSIALVAARAAAGPTDRTPTGTSLAEEVPCVIVVRAGLPQDELGTAVDVVRRQGGHLLGGVLLTR